MDLSLNESQNLIKETVRRLMEKECTPQLLQDVDSDESGFPAEIWNQLSQMGMVGLGIPESYGGGGGSYQDLGVLYHEMGRACIPTPHLSSAVLCAEIILETGSEAQKSEFLPGIASGERILALALTEPDLGWQSHQIQLSATKQDDGYVLQGTELFVPDAQIAHQLVVAARTGPTPSGDITLFLVNTEVAGLGIRKLDGFIGGRLNQIIFDSVKVSDSAVIGQVGSGWPIVETVMTRAAAVLCAYMVGGCEKVFELTRDYANTRVAFGANIGTFQRVQDHVIEIVNAMDAARWSAAEALWKLDTKKPDWRIAASYAKATASESYQMATYRSHEVFAGAGSVKEHPLHFYTRMARTLSAYLGDAKFHRNRLADLLEL